ncbi:MAG: lipoyl domain-containing protein, partial [Bacteroidales bacterium]|nr:lipoyl domain-containing protein [Bacteroidales bacterium]
MATAVIMPRQGQSVETCIITKWFRQKGDRVSAGDLLFSYETDKAAFDVEAPCDGLILDIFQAEGSEVPVLSNVAVIGSEGESAAAFSPG